MGSEMCIRDRANDRDNKKTYGGLQVLTTCTTCGGLLARELTWSHGMEGDLEGGGKEISRVVGIELGRGNHINVQKLKKVLSNPLRRLYFNPKNKCQLTARQIKKRQKAKGTAWDPTKTTAFTLPVTVRTTSNPALAFGAGDWYAIRCVRIEAGSLISRSSTVAHIL